MLCVVVVHSFLLYKIPSYKYITTCLSVLLMDICVVSRFGLLWITQLCTFLYITFGEHMSSFLYVSLEVELLGHRVGICSAWLILSNSFPKWLCQFKFSSKCLKMQFDPIQPLYFFVFFILLGLERFQIVILICICLMTNAMECLFIHLLTIWICSFVPIHIFLPICMVCLNLIVYRNFWYIQDTSPFLDMCITNTFYETVVCLFTFSDCLVSYCWIETLSLFNIIFSYYFSFTPSLQ